MHEQKALPARWVDERQMGAASIARQTLTAFVQAPRHHCSIDAGRSSRTGKLVASPAFSPPLRLTVWAAQAHER